ncbi:cytochrome c biogenesis protein ResB [Actinoplanes sp. ATCC 53533]|uniref:cytochrome c biogenesis protein ResB n=1 Tax=Actinoplanes sp. ATCC 53533 TaxID=1288362 RepID=UPI000F773452|nr:cytochrome c biogenesis protein ResB [Actinoplanes sp. ATCC 53533]RSM71645.1 cytochrome c biogenesis protein ResB [Actinoplanes sp. ATCC 53533]
MILLRLARRWWRQLTSMRTALLLLFLLAVAAAPGSMFPQRNLGAEKVDAYYAANPALAPWLDRVDLFDVYASPWFGAIYLLLMTSLIGCLLPRLRDHATALRRRPPQAPRHLSRLSAHARLGTSALDAVEAAGRLRMVLSQRRYRVALHAGTDGHVSIAAEKGHLRETGNLLFHFALLALLVGVAAGYGWGWYGNRLLVAGPDTGFCTGVQQFDEYGLGPRINATDVPGYCFELQRFTAEFLDNGQPTVFRADVTWSTVDGRPESAGLQVNDPLRLGDATMYLLGHGYAPVLRYTDRAGRAQTSVTPFLPVDGMLTSDGVVLFPDANADTRTGKRSSDAQVGFSGVFMPTAGAAAVSAYPGERDPVVILNAYRGDLGLDSGIAQSVYQLPRRPLADGRLQQIPGRATTLRPGERWTLDDGSTLEFVGTRRWITVTVRDDPGEPIVLAAAVALLAGLLCSLSVRRRRVWFRVTPGPDGCSVEAAGLPRTDYSGFRAEFAAIVAAGRTAAGTRGDAQPVGVGTAEREPW